MRFVLLKMLSVTPNLMGRLLNGLFGGTKRSAGALCSGLATPRPMPDPSPVIKMVLP